MSLRNTTVQYVGDTLYLPTLEREVKHIVVRDEDAKDWEHFEPERTCRVVPLSGYWNDGTVCSECGDGLYDDYNDCLFKYCPNCGAKVVSE